MTVANSYNYAIIRYVTDPDRDVSVPVGVALACPDQGFVLFRLPAEGERIAGFSHTEAPLLKLAEAKIRGWLESGSVPYAPEKASALSEDWWNHVRDLMQYRVRIGDVRPIDCQHPADEIDSLFEAVVKPQVVASVRAKRVDGAVSLALGPVAACLSRNGRVIGYQGRPVHVLRNLETPSGTLVVEGLNLASATAEKDSDALASRLLRIKEGTPGAELVVGYLASPQGLNGEGVYKDWVEHKAGVHLYDLVREKEAFRESVTSIVAKLEDELNVGLGALETVRVGGDMRRPRRMAAERAEAAADGQE